MNKLCLILGLFISNYALAVGPKIIGKSGAQTNGLATTTDSGLMAVGAIPGVTDGSLAAVGDLGELVTDTSIVDAVATPPTTWTSAGVSIALTPGTWFIEASAIIEAARTSGAGANRIQCALAANGVPIREFTVGIVGDPAHSFAPINTLIATGYAHALLNVTTTTTYSFMLRQIGWSGAVTLNMQARNSTEAATIKAVRLR